MAGKRPCFLDLFAGAGGLSEGFIRAGFNPIAHVEMAKAACFTLMTRIARHWLINNNREDIYYNYLNRNITKDQLYNCVPGVEFNSVINYEISEKTLNTIFSQIDKLIAIETRILLRKEFFG